MSQQTDATLDQRAEAERSANYFEVEFLKQARRAEAAEQERDTLRAQLTAKDEELRSLREERDKFKAGMDAWVKHYYAGNPMTPSEHDPKKHAESCARLTPEDDRVIASFCGSHVYNPTTPCTCGADPNWKERAEKAEAELRSLSEASAGAQWQENQPLKISTRQLLQHLRTMREGVESGDSLEGSIEYTAIDVDDWNVRGAYRIGNLGGQGSVVLLVPLPSSPGAPAATSQEKP